jgi:hypothetical protein
MNKFLKALTVLAAAAALSSPASAQLSGFLSLDTVIPGPSFGARLGLNYGLSLSSTTSATFGFRYNFNFNIPSGALVFARVDADLNDNLTLGGALYLALSDIGAGNNVSVTLRPYATLTLVDTETLGVSATLTLNAPIVPAFALQPWLGVDASYSMGSLGVDFGLEADFQIIPSFRFDGLYGYVHAYYDINSPLRIFGGTAIVIDSSGFALSGGLYGPDFYGIYAGIRYNLSSAFAARLTAGYLGNGAFYVTLTGILR